MSTPTNSKSNPFKDFLKGTFADLTATVVTHQFDTVSTYVVTTKKLPPLKALYKGLVPNLCGTVVQGGAPFLFNEMIVQWILNHYQAQQLSDRQKILAGCVTAFPTALFACPFERLVKVHQLTKGTLVEAIQKAVLANGMRGFHQAYLPLAIRDCIVFGSYFGVRDVLSTQLEGLIADASTRNCVASVTAGIFAGLLSTFPQQVNIKMQADLTGKCPTVWQVAAHVAKTEGIKQFCRSAAARSLFMGPFYLALFGASTFIEPRVQRVFDESS